MKKLLFIIIIFLLSSSCFSKEKLDDLYKDINIIITINEKIIVDDILDMKFMVITSSNDTLELVVENYWPGRLRLKEEDSHVLTSLNVHHIYLSFMNIDVVKEEIKYEHYFIECNQLWFNDYYCIINIYNLENEEFKKLYDPISHEYNYTFEIESSCCSFKRVRKL